VKKAIFLDRDGTINEDVGPLFSPDQLHFIPGALEALRRLQDQFLLFIVTNQSAIGNKLFHLEDFEEFDDYFQGKLKENGITIAHTYCCPHAKEENCLCYKPHTYFLRAAARDYDIALDQSYVIGDHPQDVEMGYQAGAKTVYVLTGHGQKHQGELTIKPDLMALNLYEATNWILRKD
jgi:D-glycero-D-manno-heptose 1,7-bisphosphate phosphatase